VLAMHAWPAGVSKNPRCREHTPHLEALDGQPSSPRVACAGGAIGGALGALLLVLLGWWCMRRRGSGDGSAGGMGLPPAMEATLGAPGAGLLTACVGFLAKLSRRRGPGSWHSGCCA
jgi:hypothetical protein